MAAAIVTAQWRTGCADNSSSRLMEQERQQHLKSVKPGGPPQHQTLLQVLALFVAESSVNKTIKHLHQCDNTADTRLGAAAPPTEESCDSQQPS